MSLKWFGTINPWDSTGNTGSNWPDSNNIPLAKRNATGHEFPWNLIRNDSANPVHQHYVNAPIYAPSFQKLSDYCKANSMAFQFQAWYPAYDGATDWGLMKSCFQGIVQYLQGYPVYVIIANELLTGQAGSPVDCTRNPFAQLGGKGSTGIDGFIAWVKELRKIFPANCKLGLNEFNACDQSTSPGTWNLQAAINCYNLCKQNGAALDYLGVEGYWLNTNFSNYANPLAMIDDTCNRFGSQTGASIIYSECTLDVPNKGPRFYSKQLDLWKAVLGKLSDNQYVIGFTGPWGGYRYSTIWNGSSGENCRGLNWMYNDSYGNASQDPDGGSNVAPGAVTQSLTWLQTWVPANVTGDSNPNPPMPESPDGTVVLNDSGKQIIDNQANAWTCVGGVVKKNNQNAGYSANVVQIAYVSHTVWQTNSADQWWSWNGTGWQSGNNPLPQPPPTLASGTYTVPAGSQIIVP